MADIMMKPRMDGRIGWGSVVVSDIWKDEKCINIEGVSGWYGGQWIPSVATTSRTRLRKYFEYLKSNYRRRSQMALA